MRSLLTKALLYPRLTRLGALLVFALIMFAAPRVVEAQHGCVLGCPEPPVREAWLEAVLAIALAWLQIWAVITFG